MSIASYSVDVPSIPLPETDGVPVESPWHHAQISLLIDVTTWHLRERQDFFVGGNLFLYYSREQIEKKSYRGPDYMFVWGAERERSRRYWAVWEEGGRFPNLIIELLSPSTAREDRTTKKKLYESVFRTEEYLCYEPEEEVLEGWRLGAKQRYQKIAGNKQGWAWSEQLELWLGTWHGSYLNVEATWLRFFTTDGEMVPTKAEAAAAEAERLARELAVLKRRRGS
jgi:Uma2 family endonuclease